MKQIEVKSDCNWENKKERIVERLTRNDKHKRELIQSMAFNYYWLVIAFSPSVTEENDIFRRFTQK